MIERESLPPLKTRPFIRVSELPVVKGLARSFDQSAEDAGLHEAAANLLKRFKCRVNVSYEDPETPKILSGKSSIVITTHVKCLTGTLSLAGSLPPRNDTHILGNACFLTWGKSFKNFLLPLYVSASSTRGLKAKFLAKTEFESGNPNSRETSKKNVSSIREAVKKINEGHQIVMLPDGNGSSKKPQEGVWHNGIGHIIRGLQNPTDTYIVMAKVNNPHLQPSINEGKLSLFNINVDYLTPIRVSDFLSQLDPKSRSPEKITRAIEKNYYGFKPRLPLQGVDAGEGTVFDKFQHCPPAG